MKEETKKEIIKVLEWYTFSDPGYTGTVKYNGAETVLQNYLNGQRVKIEQGKWYVKEWNDGDKDVFFAETVKDGKVNYKGHYFRNNILLSVAISRLCELIEISKLYSLRLATKEEVEGVLITEAIRRGVWQVPIVFYCEESENLIGDERCYSVFYSLHINRLWSSYGIVWEDGKWATPLKDSKLDELEKKYKELGEEIKRLKQN